MSGTFINGRVDEFYLARDTSGNIINASDGGIIYAEGRYHWYGQALRPMGFASGGKGGQVTDTGVVMYASDDLVNWEYEGVIMPCSNDENSPLRAPMRFERPKIIYNERTHKYVLWCHYVGYPGDHGFSDTGGEALSAVCERVNGTYELCQISRPIDRKGVVRDSSIYQDADGSAYFIYDRNVTTEFKKQLKPFERCLHIVKLTDDYLRFTDEYARIDACDQREAPCVIKHGEYYYMITSGLTGWEYNQALYFRSKQLMSGWELMGDPFVGDVNHTSFNTQGTFIFTTKDGSDIYMCERHNTKNFLECAYIWFKINYTDNGEIKLHYSEQIQI